MRRRTSGFTLFEALFVIFTTAIVIGMITTMFMTVTRGSQASVASTREIRLATAVLDRIANDVESAFLVSKDPEADPLTHPWVFIAEGRQGQDGADRLLFTTLAHRSDALAVDPEQRKSAAGLATYAYFLEPDDALGAGDVPRFVLMRWVNPFLAEDHAFPRRDDPGTIAVAEDVARFSLHFLADGGWVDEWDSTLIADSSELPVAVEIRLALWPDLTPEELDDYADRGEEPPLTEYRRRVVLYQRPLADVGVSEAVANLASDGEEEEEECKITYGQCFGQLGVAANPRNTGFAAIWNNCVRPGDETIFDANGNPIDVTPCLR
ncbi:MAG: hypothetical protein R3E88_09455 [Myxococcota bacterium]|nr:hypothetical protein [Myxococcales bacterium]